MAIYVATLRQSFASMQIINRFSYVSTVEPTGVNGSNMLAKYMGVPPVAGVFPGGTLLETIQDLQSSSVIFQEVEVMNLYDPTDFYVVPFPSGVVGAITGNTDSSPLLSYGLRSNRITREIRRGTKRFVGVCEEALLAGGTLVGGQIALLQDVADAMSAVLNPANTDSEGVYTPAVLKYQKYTTPSGRTAYKPQDTEGAQLANAAIGVTWEIYEQVRSQVSRQYGRGA